MSVAFKLEKEGFEGRMGNTGNPPATCVSVQTATSLLSPSPHAAVWGELVTEGGSQQ